MFFQSRIENTKLIKNQNKIHQISETLHNTLQNTRISKLQQTTKQRIKNNTMTNDSTNLHKKHSIRFHNSFLCRYNYFSTSPVTVASSLSIYLISGPIQICSLKSLEQTKRCCFNFFAPFRMPFPTVSTEFGLPVLCH